MQMYIINTQHFWNDIDMSKSRFDRNFQSHAFLSMAAFLLLLLAMTLPALSSPSKKLEMKTNQTWIETLKLNKDVQVNSVENTFKMVFSNLPSEVFVYPTENYYYFTFSAGGVTFAGNLRLAAQDRDDGVIHFAVFKQANQANKAGKMMYKALVAADGVAVKKESKFSYKVTHGSKSVTFKLNDVSSVKPAPKIVADGEKYLGLVVDESGLQFFLFYNETHKLFVYVLDESGTVLDEFIQSDFSNRILVGHRTGFAVYDHHHLDRRVLIGVHSANTVVNNYYDGPADQLPENHITNDNLRKSIVDSDPSVKDQLDKFGYFKTGEGRYLITPYLQYLNLDELLGYDECATDPNIEPTLYDGCFFAGDQ